MKKKYDIIIGRKYGDLICIGSHIERLKSGYTATRYTMKCCICGREKDLLAPSIAKDCGTSHKACGKGLKWSDKTFYSRWQAMRTRTNNSNYQHADCYSERGINSDEFQNFIDFYDAMHDSYLEAVKKYGEDNVSLDRIDVNGNYTKENCRWIPKNKQQGNTRKTVSFKVIFPDGHSEIHKNLMEFTREHDLDYSTAQDVIRGRITHHRHYKFERLENSEGVTTIENEGEAS